MVKWAERFIIILLSTVGFHISFTASHISSAKSSSVSLKLSGEYSMRTRVPAASNSSAIERTRRAPFRAISIISARDILNVTLRCNADVLLYRCTIALFAPFRDSNVFRIRCSRLWVRTCNDTPSGTRFSSISFLVKEYSVSLAEGKPTSISLKPIFKSSLYKRSFSSTPIGIASAWFPSRKSTLHHIGARVIFLDGHCLSGRSILGLRMYLLFVCILFSLLNFNGIKKRDS